MEILRVTFEAGETHTFHKSGRYFEVMKASAPFDAWFTDRAIGVYPCLGLEAGVYSELPFQQLQITSATAQTVTLLISDFRAGFRSQIVDSARDTEKAILTAGQNAVPAFSEVGGWVSGDIKNMPPAGGRAVIFDLGQNWTNIERLHVFARISTMGESVTVYGFAENSPTENTDTWMGMSPSAAAAYSVTVNQTQRFYTIALPAKRFAKFLCYASASGTGPDADIQIRRIYK